ncbi:hypothetical protein COR50_09680 [Chitinophaga caeni]|uniref:Uncharacterized protein n=1 Tax=Chitinophaga caeni TaxID=2029983 RepID=A0A291QTX0_9BACT|nr:hypothetical protein COR50_09680 [Chitinophaga caeni]
MSLIVRGSELGSSHQQGLGILGQSIKKRTGVSNTKNQVSGVNGLEARTSKGLGSWGKALKSAPGFRTRKIRFRVSMAWKLEPARATVSITLCNKMKRAIL